MRYESIGRAPVDSGHLGRGTTCVRLRSHPARSVRRMAARPFARWREPNGVMCEPLVHKATTSDAQGIPCEASKVLEAAPERADAPTVAQLLTECVDGAAIQGIVLCALWTLGALVLAWSLGYTLLLRRNSEPLGEPIRGVNLGGWLLAERWIMDGLDSSPFANTSWMEAPDELTLCEHVGTAEAARRFKRHRDTFITRDDFAAIASAGLNTVRVPFGHWVVVRAPPFAGPALGHLDAALGWADEFGLKVILDLHGAPGFQNADVTSGHRAENWDPRAWDPAATLDVIRRVAERYAGHPAVVGFEVLNEPSGRLPAAALARFYREAYLTVRRAGMDARRVAVLVNLYPAPRAAAWSVAEGLGASLGVLDRLHLQVGLTRELGTLLAGGLDPSFENVVYDLHVYNCFNQASLLPLAAVVKHLPRLQAQLLSMPARRTIVGEWSLQLPFEGRRAAAEARALSAEETDRLLRDYAHTQRRAFEHSPNCVGWVFWTWKAAPREDHWSLQTALRRGWIDLTDRL